jgi:hypothetical protein
MIAAFVFGSIFVFANPDLLDSVSASLSRLTTKFQIWLQGMSFWEIPFCIVALFVGAGLMRPFLPLLRVGPEDDSVAPQTVLRSPLYLAARNTLLTLISLFAVYLVFEFITLWLREFPDGFYYAGYAHQGAAWLTFALALATAVLSMVFSRKMLRDDRQDKLRTLAWIWSAQNLLLAVAVYNRLMIYVGYNGMTRMRTVGFFGITVVVIGFCLVLYKIRNNRGFWWLLRSQLVALTLTIIAYSIFPVDYVAHRYNARAVSSGYLHPSVMIAVKPIQDEGVIPLLQLADCDDPTIREGVRAILAKRQHEIELSPTKHWTEYQASRSWLSQILADNESQWAEFLDPGKREKAIMDFREYAMQWY